MFDITFLGSSGGPVEGTNCCILIKHGTKNYNEIINNNLDDEILCIDAGSGLNKLSEIIYHELNNIDNNPMLNLYDDDSKVQDYFHPHVDIIHPFKHLKLLPNHQDNPITNDNHQKLITSPIGLAMQVFKNIKHYVISHPHLDHINSLVLNSPNFSTQNYKNIIASSNTIEALDKYIFNGIIWPNMQEFDILKLHKIEYYETFEIGHFIIKMFKLSHGKLINNPRRNKSISLNENFQLNQTSYNHNKTTPYLSSAFLISTIDTNPLINGVAHQLPTSGITNEMSEKILIFGDFESDAVSGVNFNLIIWKEIGPLIVTNRLKVIILECSNSNLSKNDLYGHLNPVYLFQELVVLNNICKSISNDPFPLRNLNIVVNHIKETPFDNPRSKILEILNHFNQEHNLMIKFSIALSGVSISI